MAFHGLYDEWKKASNHQIGMRRMSYHKTTITHATCCFIPRRLVPFSSCLLKNTSMHMRVISSMSCVVPRPMFCITNGMGRCCVTSSSLSEVDDDDRFPSLSAMPLEYSPSLPYELGFSLFRKVFSNVVRRLSNNLSCTAKFRWDNGGRSDRFPPSVAWWRDHGMYWRSIPCKGIHYRRRGGSHGRFWRMWM